MNVVKPIAKVKNESYKKNVRFNIDDCMLNLTFYIPTVEI